MHGAPQYRPRPFGSEDRGFVTYDTNTNTNYNPVVDEEAGRSGPVAVAQYLAALAKELETDRIVTPSGLTRPRATRAASTRMY